MPRRGAVREFSRKSRTRLQQTLCAVPVAHVGRGLLFITLTYPKHYPGTWQTWKAQLNHLAVSLGRKFPRLGAVWKLEPQRRGAPHFHLLVVGVPFLAANWLRWTWSRIVQPGIGPPRNLRVDVQLARSHRGVVSYASKYVAKRQALPADWQEGVGRWWGVFGRKNVGIVWNWLPLSQPQYYSAVRIVRGLIGRRRRSSQRAPPRSLPAGCWAVLSDVEAGRLAACVVNMPHKERSLADIVGGSDRRGTVYRIVAPGYHGPRLRDAWRDDQYPPSYWRTAPRDAQPEPQ